MARIGQDHKEERDVMLSESSSAMAWAWNNPTSSDIRIVINLENHHDEATKEPTPKRSRLCSNSSNGKVSNGKEEKVEMPSPSSNQEEIKSQQQHVESKATTSCKRKRATQTLEDEVLHLSSAILCSYSEYFRGALSQPLEERSTRTLSIQLADETDRDVFIGLLKQMYCTDIFLTPVRLKDANLFLRMLRISDRFMMLPIVQKILSQLTEWASMWKYACAYVSITHQFPPISDSSIDLMSLQPHNHSTHTYLEKRSHTYAKGFHHLSTRIIIDASTRLSPMPPALSESNKIRWVGSFLNWERVCARLVVVIPPVNLET